MAWEDRNGNPYYYRKRREGKRVVSEYVGPGLIGQMAAELDAEDRLERGCARANLVKQRTETKAIDQQVRDVESQIRTLTRAFLLAAGYHPHKRQWRKKRNG